MDPELVLRRLGGIASTARLDAAGVSERALTAASRDGRIDRLRRGWYALPSTAPTVRAAVRLGGVVSCITALRELGVLVPDDPAPHLALPRHATCWRHRLRTGDDPEPVVHRLAGPAQSDHVRDSVGGAIRIATRCLSRERSVAAIDSALRLQLTSVSELRQLGVAGSLLRVVDPAAESIGETAVRLRLIAIGCRFRPQVDIPGVGRVDFVVGDRLVIEVDGYSVHGTRAAFERDRARDRRLVELGYLVIRLTYRQLEEDWPRIERAIRSILRSRRHLNRRTRGTPARR